MSEKYMTSVRELQRVLADVEIRAMILGGEEIVVDVPRKVVDQAASIIGGLRRGRWFFTRYWYGSWQGYELELRGYGRV